MDNTIATILVCSYPYYINGACNLGSFLPSFHVVVPLRGLLILRLLFKRLVNY